MSKLKITLKKGVIKKTEKQKRTVRALGLRKIHQSVIHDDSEQIRGMVSRVSHLVDVEEVK